MGETQSRYPNTGLHLAESLFVSAHPRAAQYLDQAPVIVMWAVPWASSYHDSASTFVRAWIAANCEDGIGPKDFLRASGFSAPMRSLSARVILPKQAGTYRMLARVPAAVLGRCIPTTDKAQRAWRLPAGPQLQGSASENMSDRGGGKFGGAFALGVNNCMVGVRDIPPLGWRVVLKIGEEAMQMPASQAREMAKTFETPFARLSGFGEVGDKLRELADECDQLRGIRDRE